MLNRLEEIAKQIAQKSQPPVHLWKPDHVGEIDIRIDVNGQWFHEGDQIQRDKMVVLFASILWSENEDYFLVTPVEKLRIDVADVPFIVHQAEYTDQHWVIVTNTHEQIIVGEEHPVRLQNFNGQQIPYVNVRYDLWARVSRGVYYQWVEQALESDDSDQPLLSSGDYKFHLA